MIVQNNYFEALFLFCAYRMLINIKNSIIKYYSKISVVLAILLSASSVELYAQQSWAMAVMEDGNDKPTIIECLALKKLDHIIYRNKVESILSNSNYSTEGAASCGVALLMSLFTNNAS